MRLGFDGDDLGESWLSVVLLDAAPGTYLVVGWRKEGVDEYVDHMELDDAERASAYALRWREDHLKVALWQKIG